MLGLILVDSMDHNVLGDNRELEEEINKGRHMFTLSKVNLSPLSSFLLHYFPSLLSFSSLILSRSISAFLLIKQALAPIGLMRLVGFLGLLPPECGFPISPSLLPQESSNAMRALFFSQDQFLDTAFDELDDLVNTLNQSHDLLGSQPKVYLPALSSSKYYLLSSALSSPLCISPLCISLALTDSREHTNSSTACEPLGVTLLLEIPQTTSSPLN